MAKTIDYYLSPASPWTYLGSGRLIAMAKAAGATVNVKAIDTGAVFAATGGLPLPQRHPARQAYRLVELERWRSFLKVPLNLHPAFFPVADVTARKLIVAARQGGHDALHLSHALLRAVWAEEKNIADEATLRAIVTDCGLPASLFDAAEAPGVAAEIEANTAEAIERNVVGVPNYFVDGQPHWGQDRLDFVERALQA
jgi:2-hydroxychromene-2-carboxylate isomerase